jgi:hypothetical protein
MVETPPPGGGEYKSLHLLRHAIALHNEPNMQLTAEQTFDAPLSERGKQQVRPARATSAYMRQEAGLAQSRVADDDLYVSVPCLICHLRSCAKLRIRIHAAKHCRSS